MLRVESLHGLAFHSPPKVHVCATLTCFTRWVKTPGLTAAVVAENRLVLSPRLYGQEAHRLSGILTHELSYLHLSQRLGHYTIWLPVWFHEGLATRAAGGAGVEAVSDRAAHDAWQSGRRVDFNRRDTPGRRYWSDDFGLTIPEFYRQSWRAVELLQAHEPAAFRRWLVSLPEDGDFRISFADAYNSDLSTLASALFEAAAVQGFQHTHE